MARGPLKLPPPTRASPLRLLTCGTRDEPLRIGLSVESVLELASVALNKNTVPGDKSAFIPGGIRIGTPALTTRGLTEAHFDTVRAPRRAGGGDRSQMNDHHLAS